MFTIIYLAIGTFLVSIVLKYLIMIGGITSESVNATEEKIFYGAIFSFAVCIWPFVLIALIVGFSLKYIGSVIQFIAYREEDKNG